MWWLLIMGMVSISKRIDLAFASDAGMSYLHRSTPVNRKTLHGHDSPNLAQNRPLVVVQVEQIKCKLSVNFAFWQKKARKRPIFGHFLALLIFSSPGPKANQRILLKCPLWHSAQCQIRAVFALPKGIAQGCLNPRLPTVVLRAVPPASCPLPCVPAWLLRRLYCDLQVPAFSVSNRSPPYAVIICRLGVDIFGNTKYNKINLVLRNKRVKIWAVAFLSGIGKQWGKYTLS